MAEMEGELIDHQSITSSPLKRKPNLMPDEEEEAERTMKQQKSDSPDEECGNDGQDDKKISGNQNGNVDKDKGKAILSAVDKGKGKMVVEEEGGREFGDSSDDEDGSSEVDGEGDDDDSDFSDDPLAEMDLDNILPARTRRRRVLEPGAYLVEGKDNDDDDDDDDDDHDDDGDDEEEEEEEEEVEEQLEENK